MKSMIVGGHSNWQRKMKKRLPNFVFIDTDFVNFNSKVFNNVDTIFIYTNYISHCLYKKVVNIASKKGIKVVFLNQMNEKLTLKQIYEVYQEQ